MGHGEVGLELERRAEFGLGLGQLALRRQGVAEVVVGPDVSGWSISAARYSASASAGLPWDSQGVAEDEVGLGVVGLELRPPRGPRRRRGPGRLRLVGPAVGLQAPAEAGQVPRSCRACGRPGRERWPRPRRRGPSRRAGGPGRAPSPAAGPAPPCSTAPPPRAAPASAVSRAPARAKLTQTSSGCRATARRSRPTAASRSPALSRAPPSSTAVAAGKLGRPRLVGQGLELRRLGLAVVGRQQGAEPVAVVVGVGGAGQLQRLPPRCRRPPGTRGARPTNGRGTRPARRPPPRAGA